MGSGLRPSTLDTSTHGWRVGHRVGWLPFMWPGLRPRPRPRVAHPHPDRRPQPRRWPAWGVGRDEMGKRWGGLAGMLLYLGLPSRPWRSVTTRTWSSPSPSSWVPSGSAAAGTRRANDGPRRGHVCREELVPMIVLIGFTHPGSIRARIRWGMKARTARGRVRSAALVSGT